MKAVEVALLFDKSVVPTRKHQNDAGLDLYSYMVDEIGREFALEIPAGQFAIINTGIAVGIPVGCVGLIWPKSKSDFLIGGGVVDAGYRGEIKVKIFNPTVYPLKIRHGEAVAQLLIQPVETPAVMEVDKVMFDKVKTERGKTGGIVSQYQQATFLSDVTSIE